MQLFWIELKKAVAKPTEKSPVIFWKKSYGVQVMGNGMNIDGSSIARNYATFWIMYQSSTDIMRCIEEKVQTAMKKGFELQKKHANGKMKVVEDDAFIQALGDTHEIKKLIIMALDIFGDVFIRRVRNIRGGVIRYEVLDTREVSIITNSMLSPLNYTYRRTSPGSVSVEKYPATDVEHFKIGHNYSNPLFWMTVLSTLVYDTLSDDEASKVNYFHYLNDAIPSSLFIIKDGLTEDEWKGVVRDIQDTLKGSHNAGKSIFSNSVTDVKPIQQPNMWSEDIMKRRYITEKICAGLGVPRSVLGYIEDVNYSNGDIQLKKFIENTIQPLETLLEKIFTKLSQDFSGYNFVVNSEHIDQLEQLARVARDNVNAGLWTRNEAREYLGWDAVADELANELTISSSMQLLDNLLLGEPTIEAPVDAQGNPITAV